MAWFLYDRDLPNERVKLLQTQSVFTCPTLTMEITEQRVKYAQSQP